MSVVWMRDGSTLYGVAARRRFVIEPLPGKAGWDWASWTARETPESAARGIAPSVIEAMAEAEVTAHPGLSET